MKNKLLISLLILSLTLLNGCQLAKTDTITRGQDRLIGCFVTTEYIDTFDFDKYISTNSSKLGKGDIAIDSTELGYDKKLYITMTKVPNPTGTFPNLEWDFKGLKGYYYFTPSIDYDGEMVTESCHSEGLGDAYANRNFTDESENSSLHAKLYVSPTGRNMTFYVNPMYQSPDGSVYIVGGDGMSGDETLDEGPFMSLTLKDTLASSFNEESKSSTNEVTLAIEVKFLLKESTILEMGKDNKLIKETPIDLNNIPKDFKPSQDTEYIILESTKIDPNKKEYTSVEVYDKKKYAMDIYINSKQGIMEKVTTNLIWE